LQRIRRKLGICAKSLVLAVLACIFLAFTPAESGFAYQNYKVAFSTQEELAQDIALAPCKDSERLSAVKVLFMKMGAREDELAVERLDGVENLVLRKKGKSSATIVIGAHYDKVAAGCGAIDNWTGIVTLAHIFKGFKEIPVEKNLVFVAFGREEQGLLGSKAMVRAIRKEEVNDYCAMVNIDSLGMGAPQVLENTSSESLIRRAVDIAKRINAPLSRVTINGTDADSSSFMSKKIPAITIAAVSSDWQTILHSDNDRVARVNAQSVYIGYRLALALVGELHNLPCEVSRK
jgi:acetylornithine deacetylase/succinyl-diaminopimelate desuccinylase-like protein